MPNLSSLVNPNSAVITNSVENPVQVSDPELQGVSLSLNQITNILSMLTISTVGRLNVEVNSGNINAAITSLNTIGGVSTNEQVPAIINTLYQSGIRKQILTS
jgi:hypothetical protein